MGNINIDFENGVFIAVIGGLIAFIIMWVEVNRNIKYSKSENDRQFYFQVTQNSATEMLKLLNKAIKNLDELSELEEKYSKIDKEKWFEVSRLIKSNLEDLNIYIYSAPVEKNLYDDSIKFLTSHTETVNNNLIDIEIPMTYNTEAEQNIFSHLETREVLINHLYLYRKKLAKEYGEKIEVDMRNIEKENGKFKLFKKLQKIQYLKIIIIIFTYFLISYLIIPYFKLSEFNSSLLLSLIVGGYLYFEKEEV